MSAREWVAVVLLSLLVGAVGGAVGLIALEGLWTLFSWLADAGEAMGFR